MKKTQRLQLDSSAAATSTAASNQKKQKMSSSYHCPILDLLDANSQRAAFEFVRTNPSD